MRRWCGVALWLVGVGCSNTSSLGLLTDAGGTDREAVADQAAIDAPDTGPPDPCVPAGTAFGRSTSVAQSARRYTARVGSVTMLTSRTDMRVGTATTFGSSLIWAVSDDRCGLRGDDQWWGVQLAELQHEPDQRLRVRWSCLEQSWAGVNGYPFVTSAGLSVMTRQHATLLRPSERWREGDFMVGTVVDEPPDFAWMFNPSGLESTVRFTVRDDGIDLVYATRDHHRRYARLDASLAPTRDPVLLGPGGDELHNATVGPQPWTEGRFIAAWKQEDGVLGDQVEVFDVEGLVSERWRLDDHVSFAGARLRTQWLAPVECGAEFVATQGEEPAATAVYRGRLWHDGRWSLQPLAGAMQVGHVLRLGELRLMTLVDPRDEVLSIMAFDENGAVVMAPTVIDRGHGVTSGDLQIMPGTGEVAVLYATRETSADPVLAKAALVVVEPVR